MTSPSSKHDFRSVPLSSHVTDNYIRASPSTKHDLVCPPMLPLAQLARPWTVTTPDTTVDLFSLFVVVHSWLHLDQSQLQTRLLVSVFPIEILSNGNNDPLSKNVSVKQVKLGVTMFK